MTRGMVLGKFLPPHRGHVHLCEFARHWVDDLTIVVGTLEREPIPGELRAQWMRELFPFDRVVHLTDENPQYPSESDDFWHIWRTSLLRVLPAPPDIVFASEPYGEKLAEVLGARFVMVDATRSTFPVSGTAIRADPLKHWDDLPRCVRPHFVKRVSVFGPESTGKTTLAARLASELSTVWVPERARTLLEQVGGDLVRLNWHDVIKGQIASEEALARDARGTLICDTDPLETVVWAETFGMPLDASLVERALARRYGLTLLLAPDVPWVADVARFVPGEGSRFFERCEAILRNANRPYVIINGDWETRTNAAREAVRALWITPDRGSSAIAPAARP